MLWFDKLKPEARPICLCNSLSTSVIELSTILFHEKKFNQFCLCIYMCNIYSSIVLLFFLYLCII